MRTCPTSRGEIFTSTDNTVRVPGFAGSDVRFRLLLEHSSNAGGLLRWPIKLVLPLGFALVALQGISELIKRVAFLNDYAVDSLEAHYERPTQ